MTYILPDAKPLAGNNFYRIRALNKDGKTEYSAVVKINLGKGIAAISFYPNPVTKNGSLNLQLQNLNKGYYLVTVFDQHGKQVLKQVVSHEGGNSVQAIVLPKLSAGAYSINVNSKDVKFVKTIVVE